MWLGGGWITMGALLDGGVFVDVGSTSSPLMRMHSNKYVVNASTVWHALWAAMTTGARIGCARRDVDQSSAPACNLQSTKSINGGDEQLTADENDDDKLQHVLFD